MTKEFAQLLVAQAPWQVPYMHPVHRRPPFFDRMNLPWMGNTWSSGPLKFSDKGRERSN
jgi:hypothetical protein